MEEKDFRFASKLFAVIGAMHFVLYVIDGHWTLLILAICLLACAVGCTITGEMLGNKQPPTMWEFRIVEIYTRNILIDSSSISTRSGPCKSDTCAKEEGEKMIREHSLGDNYRVEVYQI